MATQQQTASPVSIGTALLGWLLKLVIKYPFIAVYGGVLVLIALAFKAKGEHVNIGGLIGQLMNQQPKVDGHAVDIVNTVAAGRVDDKNKPIPVGVADKQGFTQVQQKEVVRDINPFRNTDVVKVKESDGSIKAIKLPTGVKDTDVEKVIQVQPKVYAVKVTDKNPIDKATMDTLANHLL